MCTAGKCVTVSFIRSVWIMVLMHSKKKNNIKIQLILFYSFAIILKLQQPSPSSPCIYVKFSTVGANEENWLGIFGWRENIIRIWPMAKDGHGLTLWPHRKPLFITFICISRHNFYVTWEITRCNYQTWHPATDLWDGNRVKIISQFANYRRNDCHHLTRRN